MDDGLGYGHIWLYFSPEAPNLKNEGAFLSSTLKFEEKKVPLFFRFKASGLRYSHFVILMIASTWRQTKKIRKRQYLNPEATTLISKGTFYSSNFKVEEKKVPLFFRFEAAGAGI